LTPRSKGAGDARLQEIAAEALKEVYFQDGGRRAGSLEEVRFTDIEHLEFDLQQPLPDQPVSPAPEPEHDGCHRSRLVFTKIEGVAHGRPEIVGVGS